MTNSSWKTEKFDSVQWNNDHIDNFLYNLPVHR